MPRLVVGKNDLASQRPDLAKEWHPERNGSRTPEMISSRSNETVWWLGSSCGHEWSARVGNRWVGSGCPYCSTKSGRKRVLPGFNDLATLRPDLAREWSVKNTKTPSQVTPGSHYRALWECGRGHTWETSVNNRTSADSGCGQCSGRVVSEGENGLLVERPYLATEWAPSNSRDIATITLRSGYQARWVCSKGHVWSARVSDRTRGGGRSTACPTCSAEAFVSSPERAVAEYIRSLGVEIQTSYRGVAGIHELDIVVLGSRIAVEFNGLYWHSEACKDRDYHSRKSLAASKEGWQLIHVWEDDWTYRRGIVEQMIARKLGVSTESRYNARSLEKMAVTAKEARTFLDANHIQGFVASSEYLALKDGDDIRALMAMKRRSNGDWELTRFATDGIVRGGFSRLFKWFQAAHPEVTRVVTFADRGVSDGGLYESHGFVRDGEIAPDYMYVVRGQRDHKFNYRKARFKKDPNLKYEDGLTERQLADLNGLRRIYDAGKVRWVWNAKTPSE